MPFISVEEIVKSLCDIEFDESNMDWSFPVPSELLQNNAEHQEEDLIQLQADDQPRMDYIPIISLEMVKYNYFSSVTFLADAAQTQIKKKIENDTFLSKPAQD